VPIRKPDCLRVMAVGSRQWAGRGVASHKRERAPRRRRASRHV